MFDLIIRGGTIVDGSGAPAYAADIAVDQGRVSELGRVEGLARRVIDVDGALVTPGFVDIHTHYDGQVTWDSRVAPSAWHGVTTVVMGNCGVGFAPVRAMDRQRLIELMEGVEDIPGAALHEGLTWDWETFPEYLDVIEARAHDIDVAAQVPHGALRLYVMGERGAEREPATAAEIAQMGALVREAVQAGALGFTTSRTLNHRTSRGEPTPTLTAAAEELLGIAAAMGTANAGVFEVVSDFPDFRSEFATLRRMVEVSGRPLSISVAAEDHRPQWRSLLDAMVAAAREGASMKGQVAARPIGVLLGLQGSVHPFMSRATYQDIASLPLAERVRVMRDQDFRQRLLAETPASPGLGSEYHRVFEIGDPPDYEPPPEKSVAARAQREGRPADEVAYDLLLQNEGREFLYFPVYNYAAGNLDEVRAMLLHEGSVPGLGDGGAHVGFICDASFPTTLLTLWARDRVRGPRLELPLVVRRQTWDTACAVGLCDRGLLAPGMKADINVIDFARLRLHRPEMAFDLPAGGKRLLQRAEGYLHTFVSGEEVYANGEATDALPGQLVRGHRPRP